VSRVISLFYQRCQIIIKVFASRRNHSCFSSGNQRRTDRRMIVSDINFVYIAFHVQCLSLSIWRALRIFYILAAHSIGTWLDNRSGGPPCLARSCDLAKIPTQKPITRNGKYFKGTMRRESQSCRELQGVAKVIGSQDCKVLIQDGRKNWAHGALGGTL
jgi:hypothetical protein